MLSADSITYLSAATHLRAGDGLVDFTHEPLAHFPPVLPVLLAPGGRSLGWATIVGAVAAAAVAVSLLQLLASRVRIGVALAGTTVYALSQAAVRIESTVWSETPYLALALAAMWVLARKNLTVSRSAVAGGLAGLAFLTRYSGAAIVVTGFVMVLVATASAGRARQRRCVLAFLTPPAVLAALWIARNLVATGEPLGPHFEGGAGDTVGDLSRQLAWGVGQLVTDLGSVTPLTRPIGWVVLAGLIVAAGVALAPKPRNVLDVGMAAFAGLSIVVPIASRVVAGTDLSARILSPILIPLVYLVAVVVDQQVHRRVVIGVAAVAAIASVFVGASAAVGTPDRVDVSVASRRPFAPELYDLVAALPDDAIVVTNNPQRVWWHAGRDPVWLAFTVPRPGNSHFPLSRDETVQLVCTGETYLAWFSGLTNAGGASPSELRPDLVERIALTPVAEPPGGTLFELEVVDPAVDTAADPPPTLRDAAVGC